MRKEIQDLLAKKDFSEGLLKLNDSSKVKDYFATEGNLNDVTDDEVKELGLGLENLMQKISELPEDKLEKIGGGVGPEDSEGGYSDTDLGNNDYVVNRLLLNLLVFGETMESAANAPSSHFTPESSDFGKKDESEQNKVGISKGAKLGIGTVAGATVIASGVGLYKVGRKRGWWGKVK